MSTLEYDETEALEQAVRLWLERRGIPQRNYENLSSYYKVLLRDLVCGRTHPTTERERRNLYQKLCLPRSVVAGRWSVDPVDSIPAEKIEKFFSPLTPGERLPYLHKF